MADFVKLNIGDWNAATDDLTLEQEAAYLRVVNAIMLYEQPFRANLRVLSGLWRCGSERKAKRLLEELIDAGKLVVEDGWILNRRALEEASNIRRTRLERASSGRAGGLQSAKSRSKPLENNNVPQAYGSTRAEQSRAEQNIDDDVDAQAREIDRSPTLRERLLAAIRIDPSGLTGPNGRIIGSQADMAEVGRWLELPGMTEDTIVAEVTRVMLGKGEPPSTLKYFRQPMQALSAALSAPPLEPSPQPPPGDQRHNPTRTGGARNDRARFDIAHQEYIRRLAAGEIKRGPDPSDPWAE